MWKGTHPAVWLSNEDVPDAITSNAAWSRNLLIVHLPDTPLFGDCLCMVDEIDPTPAINVPTPAPTPPQVASPPITISSGSSVIVQDEPEAMAVDSQGRPWAWIIGPTGHAIREFWPAPEPTVLEDGIQFWNRWSP